MHHVEPALAPVPERLRLRPHEQDAQPARLEVHAIARHAGRGRFRGIEGNPRIREDDVERAARLVEGEARPDRNGVPVGDCLRITVGTPEENDAVLAALTELLEEDAS